LRRPTIASPTSSSAAAPTVQLCGVDVVMPEIEAPTKRSNPESRSASSMNQVPWPIRPRSASWTRTNAVPHEVFCNLKVYRLALTPRAGEQLDHLRLKPGISSACGW